MTKWKFEMVGEKMTNNRYERSTDIVFIISVSTVGSTSTIDAPFLNINDLNKQY